MTSSEFHAAAEAAEAAGNPALAGILRVEAWNREQRPADWKPIHKPNLGPYGPKNPCVCLNCGEPSRDPLKYDFAESTCDQRLLESS